MIALVQLSTVLFLTVTRYRLGWAALVFFLAFSPRSLGWGLEGGSSITLIRMAFPVLLFVAFYLSRISLVERRSNSVSLIVWVLTALETHKLVSTVINSGGLLYAIEDFFLTVILFVVVFRFATEKFFQSILSALQASIFLTTLIVFLEIAYEAPLYESFANQNVIKEGALDAAFRAGRYRAIGIFDGPLQLGEFLVYGLVTVLFFRDSARNRVSRTLAIALVILTLAGIVATGSRGAFLAAIVVIMVNFVAHRWHRLNLPARTLSIFFIIVAVPVLVVASVSSLAELSESYVGVQFYVLEERERSMASRLLQFSEVTRALGDRPFTGFGLQSNFSNNLGEIRKLDNYYLRLGLEGGYVAIGLFVLLLAVLFKALMKRSPFGDTKEIINTRTYGIMMLAGFSVMKMFLSQPGNNVYFFILMALVLARIGRLRYLESTFQATQQRTSRDS
jgi:O-antigen ligase